MGRGAAWTARECAELSRAWLHATEDPIDGIDQTAASFWNKVFETFSAVSPSDATDKQYRARGLRASRAKMEQISADLQKFRKSLRRVRLFQPTGVDENQKLSMAIAKHLGKRESITYDAKDYPHERWINHLAYKVLQKVPKFSDVDDCEGTPTSTDFENEPPEENLVAALTPTSTTTSSQENVITPAAPKTPTKRSFELSDTIGRKRAKYDKLKERHNEIALRNSASIALAMKERNNLIAEQNAIQAFEPESCVSEEDKNDRIEFMRLIRKAHLKRTREALTPTVETPNETATPSASPEEICEHSNDNDEIENNSEENASIRSPPQPPPLPPYSSSSQL